MPESVFAPAVSEIRTPAFHGTTDRPPESRHLLSGRERDAFREIATIVEYRRSGFNIFREGENAQFVYAIDEGVVRIVRHAENGRRQILAFMTPGDLFGLPDDGSYAHGAETVSAVRLYRLPWDRLIQRLIGEPQLQLNLLTKILNNLHRAQRWMVILGLQSTSQRLASLLLDFLRHPEFCNERGGYSYLSISRLDLADYLGIARETVGRVITKFERDGLVRRVGPRTIQILDVPGLQAVHPGRNM